MLGLWSPWPRWKTIVRCSLWCVFFFVGVFFFFFLPVNHAHSLVFQTRAKRGNHCFHLNTARSAINLDLYLSPSIIPEVLRIFRHQWFITPSPECQGLIMYYKLFTIINEQPKYIAQSLLDEMAPGTKWCSLLKLVPEGITALMLYKSIINAALINQMLLQASRDIITDTFVFKMGHYCGCCAVSMCYPR